MAKSDKALVWGLFAAGGTVTAFVTPVLVVLTLLPALGVLPDVLTYDSLRAFADATLGRLAIVAIVVLSLWHAAHRLRITLHDFGVRADYAVAVVVYVAAAVGSLAAGWYALAL